MILYVSFLFLKYGVKTGYIVLAPLLIFYYSIVLTDTYIKENSDAKKKKKGPIFLLFFRLSVRLHYELH